MKFLVAPVFQLFPIIFRQPVFAGILLFIVPTELFNVSFNVQCRFQIHFSRFKTLAIAVSISVQKFRAGFTTPIVLNLFSLHPNLAKFLSYLFSILVLELIFVHILFLVFLIVLLATLLFVLKIWIICA